MADFFDVFEETAAEEAREDAPRGMDDTAGVCDFCGWAGDDVLLGVCADCADDEGSRP